MLILGTLYCIILSFGYIFALSNSQSFIKQSNNQKMSSLVTLILSIVMDLLSISPAVHPASTTFDIEAFPVLESWCESECPQEEFTYHVYVS
jgi:membrane protein CcdC involved in cytochrome C biogenesis